jgi:DNA recombination protein RmuC
MQIVLLLLGVGIGVVIGWLIAKNKISQPVSGDAEKITLLDRERSVLSAQLMDARKQVDIYKSEEKSIRDRITALSAQLAESSANNKNLQEKLTSQKQELEELQKRFTKEFENLANRILDEKTTKFTEQNKNNLDIILNPLKEKLKDFEDKVDKSYKAEAAERNSLKGEIKSLIDLNKKVSEEANNLARALKGDNKKQGNWGEIILERVLERSGLVRDEEYKLQLNTTNENGNRIIPDAVLFLPDNKNIIIDSKVSLVAFEAFVNEEDETLRAKYLNDHISSIRTHVKHLGEKNYYTAPDLDAPDFVLLFIPVEAGFSAAVQGDAELFSFAWDRNIVVVSPTTLLATLRTIASIWKQERQTRNALEIAQKAGSLYDKFVGFIEDLLDIGKKMEAAKTSYSEAMNKLSSGRGNIVSKTEELKKLGAKATKKIPEKVIERSEVNLLTETHE